MAYELHIKIDHMNGGNPEHVCPETGLEAWCFHKACELNTCPESKRQREREEPEWLKK